MGSERKGLEGAGHERIRPWRLTMSLGFAARLGAASVLFAPPQPADADTLALPPELVCRTQVTASCDTACEFGGGPADLYLDLKHASVDYCRGEQCDTGKIDIRTEKGQWDGKDYLLFSGTVERGGRLWGLVSLHTLTFHAQGDAGEMFSTCSEKTG